MQKSLASLDDAEPLTARNIQILQEECGSTPSALNGKSSGTLDLHQPLLPL